MAMTTQSSKVINQSNACQMNRIERNTSVCFVEQKGNDVTGVAPSNTIYSKVFKESSDPLYVDESTRFTTNGKLKTAEGNLCYDNSKYDVYSQSKRDNRSKSSCSNHKIKNGKFLRNCTSLPNTLSEERSVDAPAKTNDNLLKFVLKKPSLQQRRLLFASRKCWTMDSYLPVTNRSELRKTSTMILFGGKTKGRRDSVVTMQVPKDSGTRKSSTEKATTSSGPSLRRASFCVPQYLRHKNGESSVEQFKTGIKIEETNDSQKENVTGRHFTVNVDIQIIETTKEPDSGYVVHLDRVRQAVCSVLGTSGQKVKFIPSKEDNSVNDVSNGVSVRRKRSTVTSPAVERLTLHRKGSTEALSPLSSGDINSPLKDIIETMKKNPRDYTYQLIGCKQLCRLAKEETVDALMCKQEGVSAIIQAVKTFRDQRDLVRTACSSLSEIATNSDSSCIQICKADGIATMLTLLRHYMNDPDVLYLLLDVLSSVSLAEESVDRLLENSGHSEMLSTMSRHPDDSHVTKQCCFVLGNIVNTVSVAMSVMYIGGVHAIIGAMQRFRCDLMVLETCCRALGCFSTHDEICLDVANAGAVKAVLVAMATAETAATLQECGCWALACLTKFSEGCDELCKNYGIEILTKTLERFRKEESIQEYGSWTVCNVAAQEHLLEYITRDNILACLLDTMTLFPENLEIQEKIFFAVSQIVMSCDERQDQLVNNRGVRKVIQVMTTFPDSQELQEHGCRIIGNLAVREHLRRTIEEDESSRAVISAMLTHDRNEQVQIYGCMALTNLTANVTDNKLSVVRNSGVTAVLNTLKELINDEQTVLCGVQTLANLMEIGDARFNFIEEEGLSVLGSLLKRHRTSADLHQFVAAILASMSSTNGLHNGVITGAEQKLQQIVDCFHGDADIELSLCQFYENMVQSESGCHFFLSHGYLQKLREIAERNHDNKDIQTSVCKSFATIAMHNYNDNGLDKLDVNIVLNAVYRFHEHTDTLMVCCGALSYMAEHNDGMRSIIIRHNGVRSVIHSLRAHVDNYRLQVVGMMALDSLFKTETEEIENQVDVLKFVTDAMCRLSENVELEIYGCSILSAIGKEVPSKTRATFDPITNILSRHRATPELQSAAVDALQSLLCGEDEDLLNDIKKELPFLDDSVWQGCFVALEIK